MSAQTVIDRTSRSGCRLRYLHQAFFSASLASAFTIFCFYYLLARLSREGNLGGKGFEYFIYWYFGLRAGVRINSFCHLSPNNVFGYSCAFLSVTLSLALVFFLVLRAIERTSIGRTVLDPVAPVFIFGILPLGALIGIGDTSAVPDSAPSGFHPVLLIMLCFAILCGFFVLTRKWAFPLWFGILLLAIYFGFFTWAYFGRDSWLIWRNLRQLFVLDVSFLFVGPLPGLAWMLYARAARQSSPETFAPTGLTRRPFAYALVLMGICLIPWLPARNHSVGRPKDIKSVAITLKRSRCFGPCPIYEVNIHGTGLVEYQGQRFVGAKGLKTTAITADSLAKLLGSFDEEHFFALDDRAFENCFDTPYATITISVDGKSKSVTGDECMANSGPKAVLRDLAEKIDDTAGSLQWVKCKGRCQY